MTRLAILVAGLALVAWALRRRREPDSVNAAWHHSSHMHPARWPEPEDGIQVDAYPASLAGWWG